MTYRGVLQAVDLPCYLSFQKSLGSGATNLSAVVKTLTDQYAITIMIVQYC